jgi:hypothetical protein
MERCPYLQNWYFLHTGTEYPQETNHPVLYGKNILLRIFFSLSKLFPLPSKVERIIKMTYYT